MDDFERYRPLLFSIAMRRVGNAAEAEDLVQEAWLRYLEVPAGEVRSPRHYLATIVKRLCQNHLASARVGREQLFGTPEPPETRATEDLLPDGPEWLELDPAVIPLLLECLSPQQRAAFVLHALFEYEHEELARLLCTSPANCRILVFRAREHLAQRQRRFPAATPEAIAALEALLRAAWQEGKIDPLARALVRECRLAGLPLPMAPMFGREQALATLRRRLLQGERRLLTLTGPPGIGKTRLALQVAAELVEAFADGVFFTPLASIRDPALVAGAIARSLGAAMEDGEEGLEQLCEHLRSREVLLVLDNFEHLVAAGPVLTRLLEAAPGLKLLVTSRAVLRLPGEQPFRIGPLSRPRQELEPTSQLLRHAAVSLFVARAREVDEHFALNEDNAEAVATLCRRLDGLPLAIELAATRTQRLSPERMLAQLDRRLSLLTAGVPSKPSRYRSLRLTLDWSFELLNADERTTFAQLGVFAGRFSLEAARALCGMDDEYAGRVPALLKSLVQKSLVQRCRLEGEGLEGASGEVIRYALLETVREYVLEQLEAAGDLEAIRARHAGYFLALAEEAEPALRGPAQTTWLKRLELDHDNLRAALAWALEHRNAAFGARLAASLCRFWRSHGHIREGIRWLEAVLALPAPADPVPRARALHGLARMSMDSGRLAQALPLFEEALALQRAAGDQTGVAQTLIGLGNTRRLLGLFPAAMASLEESLALCRASGNETDASSVLFSMALVAMDQDQLELAEPLFRDAIGSLRRLGNQENTALALTHLGLVRRRLGDLEGAWSLLKESQRLLEALESPEGLGFCLLEQGLVATAQGDCERARACFGRSARLMTATGYQPGIVSVLFSLVALAAAEGRASQVVRLLAAAEALRETTGILLAVVDRRWIDPIRAEALERIGEEAFARLWAEGQGVAAEQLFREELEAPLSPIAASTP